jgi:endoglucanase
MRSKQPLHQPQLIFQQANARHSMPAKASSISLNMRRRLFIQSSSAAMALSLFGCGGGGAGGGATDSAAASSSALASDRGFPLPSTPAATSAAASGSGYPFGARLDRYISGILPSSATNAQMDSAVAGCYDAWKSRAIVDVPSVPGGKAVRFNSPDYLVVSEGMGYGMLISVLLSGHDADARTQFDALMTTVRARPALGIVQYVGSPANSLMDWRLKMDGTSGDPANLGANAMDGDLDIAMALLMADRQWGSGGRWNYKQEALNTINALKLWNMNDDGATKGLPSPINNRTSDYMIGHFRAFKKATGDALWDRAVDRAYGLVDRMQTVYSPNAGLIPDFVINTNTATPEPSHGFIGDGTPTEGDYYANAQRDPWRFGTDYVLSGDARWRSVCNKMVTFMKADCGGDPSRIADGYQLDGAAMERRYPPKGMIGPLLCGAMVDAAHQDFLNTLWSWTVNNFTTDYYDSELMLIPMIVASGNWWNP